MRELIDIELSHVSGGQSGGCDCGIIGCCAPDVPTPVYFSCTPSEVYGIPPWEVCFALDRYDRGRASLADPWIGERARGFFDLSRHHRHCER